MIVLHKIAGYDKRTERLSIEHLVPEAQWNRVRNLAHLTPDDDGIGCYPLDPAAAASIGLQIERRLDADLYDWFLEPAQPSLQPHFPQELLHHDTDTPSEGLEVTSWPVMTIARGTLVMEDGRILAAPRPWPVPASGALALRNAGASVRRTHVLNPPGAALNVLWICAMPGAETERIGWQVNMVTRSRP